MLFNVLLDKIGHHAFPAGSQVIVYADDILLQCVGAEAMGQALSNLHRLCLHLGLVINEGKTKYQSRRRGGRGVTINNKRIERVCVYKYLGMNIGYRNMQCEVDYVKNACMARLKPLRVLACKGLGVGIPILRLMYISTVRVIIDYASPVLITCTARQLQTLEVIQNEAMRIILGCANTTRIEIMRMELDLPSIADRVREITASSVIRMVRRGDDHLAGMLADLRAGLGLVKINAYVRRLYNILVDYGVFAYCVASRPTPRLCPWQQEELTVDIQRLVAPKRESNALELKQIFLEKINCLPRTDVVHMYCDGSVHGNRAGCGVIIRDYHEVAHSDRRIVKRVGDGTSSTGAELHAIHEGLKVLSDCNKDVYVFVDSQSALLALNSRHTDQPQLVGQCRNLILLLRERGVSVNLMWIPSHVGLSLNEVADGLANEGAMRESIDTECAPSLIDIKNQMRRTRRDRDFGKAQDLMRGGSKSLQHYLKVANCTDATYGCTATRYDTVKMRLRLGYKYYGEIKGGIGPCKVCGCAQSHTLSHYVLDCPSISCLRNGNISDVTDQVCWLLTNNMIPHIVKRSKNFALRL